MRDDELANQTKAELEAREDRAAGPGLAGRQVPELLRVSEAERTVLDRHDLVRPQGRLVVLRGGRRQRPPGELRGMQLQLLARPVELPFADRRAVGEDDSGPRARHPRCPVAPAPAVPPAERVSQVGLPVEGGSDLDVDGVGPAKPTARRRGSADQCLQPPEVDAPGPRPHELVVEVALDERAARLAVLRGVQRLTAEHHLLGDDSGGIFGPRASLPRVDPVLDARQAGAPVLVDQVQLALAGIEAQKPAQFASDRQPATGRPALGHGNRRAGPPGGSVRPGSREQAGDQAGGRAYRHGPTCVSARRNDRV